MVLPEDLQTVLPAVIGHRLQPATDDAEALSITQRMRLFLDSVPIP
jgi:hypothetical protein